MPDFSGEGHYRKIQPIFMGWTILDQALENVKRKLPVK